MRSLVITLLLLAFPLVALAQDCACECPGCAAPAQLAADRAGVCVIEMSACLAGSTPCDWPRHSCAPTLYPCAPCLPVRCVSHKLLTCVELCPAPVCMPRACHKPLATMRVDDPCPVEVVLTGTHELVVSECACECSVN